jgi:hypothetical protein
MRSKVPFLVLCAALILFAPRTAKTSNEVEANLFPVSVTVNDKALRLSPDTPVLNYNGTTYIPARVLAEQIGGGILYEEESRQVKIDLPMERERKAEISQTTTDGDFSLSIHSAKKMYTTDEALEIWGTFRYNGDQQMELSHGDPMIVFEIQDESGNVYGGKQYLVEIRSLFQKGNEVVSFLPWDIVKGIALNQKEPSADQPSKSWALKKGTYTISAILEGDWQDQKQERLLAQLTIEVL